MFKFDEQNVINFNCERILFGTIIWKIVIFLLGVKRNYFRLRI